MDVWNNAVKLLQGQLRVLEHYLERKMEKYVPAVDALLIWLIPRVTECLNKFRVGQDWLTCYERMTRHNCRHAVYGFAESVILLIPPDKNHRVGW